MKKIFILFLIFNIFILSGCSFPPAVTISTLNRSGIVLEKGEKEIGFTTFLHIPTNVYFSYGLGNDWQIQGRLGITSGLSEFEIYHMEMIFGKELIRKENILANSSFGMDIWLNPENNFYGYNLSTGVTLGWIPLSDKNKIFGLYTPITFHFIGCDYRENWGTGTIFIPGIVAVLEVNKFSLKAGVNLPSYLDLVFFFNNLYNLLTNREIEVIKVGDVYIQGNIGLEFSYKW
jgi:hypothetical protein